jgi:hypothetical protein
MVRRMPWRSEGLKHLLRLLDLVYMQHRDPRGSPTRRRIDEGESSAKDKDMHIVTNLPRTFYNTTYLDKRGDDDYFIHTLSIQDAVDLSIPPWLER